MLQTLILFVYLQWIVCYWSGKSITNDNKYNEYNYNSAAIKFECIFAFYNFYWGFSSLMFLHGYILQITFNYELKVTGPYYI